MLELWYKKMRLIKSKIKKIKWSLLKNTVIKQKFWKHSNENKLKLKIWEYI